MNEHPDQSPTSSQPQPLANDASGSQPSISPEQALDDLPDEPLEAYEAFLCFIQCGPKRTLPMVAAALDTNISTIKQWSTRHRWFSRVKGYKRALSRARCSAQINAAQQNAISASDKEQQLEMAIADASQWYSDEARHHIAQRLRMDPETVDFKDFLSMAKLGKELAPAGKQDLGALGDPVIAAHWARLNELGKLAYEQIAREKAAKEQPAPATQSATPLEPAA